VKCISFNAGEVNADSEFADVPFGDHLGPGVQFDGAFVGQAPNISLETAKCRKYQRICGHEELTRP
jgi:hypothetical protein